MTNEFDAYFARAGVGNTESRAQPWHERERIDTPTAPKQRKAASWQDALTQSVTKSVLAGLRKDGYR